MLGSLKLDGHTKLTDLSGGWQRKAALARALACDPDVLLLDEPTNHLDVTTIEWLEGFLKDFRGSIIFISHDRAFIKSMATALWISIAVNSALSQEIMKIILLKRRDAAG